MYTLRLVTVDLEQEAMCNVWPHASGVHVSPVHDAASRVKTPNPRVLVFPALFLCLVTPTDTYLDPSPSWLCSVPTWPARVLQAQQGSIPFTTYQAAAVHYAHSVLLATGLCGAWPL